MTEPRFEEIYRAAGDDLGSVPWARLRPNPVLVDWLDHHAGSGRALVSGCGWGDDAAHLAERGYDVTAFDLSPTAVARAEQRFRDSGARFQVADWFDLPTAWRHAYDLVVEVGNVQALETRRRDAFAAIAATVAPAGTMFVRCYARPDGEPRGDGPPWPIARDELAGTEDAGLTLMELDDSVPGGGDSYWWSATLSRTAQPR